MGIPILAAPTEIVGFGPTLTENLHYRCYRDSHSGNTYWLFGFLTIATRSFDFLHTESRQRARQADDDNMAARTIV